MGVYKLDIHMPIMHTSVISGTRPTGRHKARNKIRLNGQWAGILPVEQSYQTYFIDQ